MASRRSILENQREAALIVACGGAAWTCAGYPRPKPRNKEAVKKFFRQLLKELRDVPRVISTDTLASDAAAKKESMPSVEHWQHNSLNNRAENAHQPTRQRERTMRRFTSPGHAQRFLSAFGRISDHFRPRRPRLKAPE